MKKSCVHCGSDRTISNGTRTTASGIVNHRYQCINCKKWFSVPIKDKFAVSEVTPNDIFVVTAAQTLTEINKDFLESLENYCRIRNAKLFVIPFDYGLGSDFSDDKVPEEYLLKDSTTFKNKLRVLANLRIIPTAENPLGGLDYLSKGDSLIVPHTQLQCKSIAVNSVDSPSMLITTGVITRPNYSITKQGMKADFNHSYSAIVVENSEEEFHLRVLNADESGGFYDISGYYTGSSHSPIEYVEALVTGDEHVMFASDSVVDATYKAKDSIVNTLKPRKIVRHDVLDSFSVSHHHKNNFLVKYGKYITGQNSIEQELNDTLNFIISTTPSFSESLIVSSNHNDHLLKWLNEADPKQEPWNAKIYHKLMYEMLNAVVITDDGAEYVNPFELWCKSIYKKDNIKFLGRNESVRIHDIEISNHGDVGMNGSRGSITQYSKLAYKQIIGHSHTPGINKGAYQVGTSSKLKLEYSRGPSSWMNTHCVIYPNGKRQLINIINGKWKV
jgi:hypothetical protein